MVSDGVVSAKCELNIASLEAADRSVEILSTMLPAFMYRIFAYREQDPC